MTQAPIRIPPPEIASNPEAMRMWKKLSRMTRAQRLAMDAEVVAQQAAIRAERRFFSMFPDKGDLRRELYPKHTAFFAAGGPHEIMVNCPKECDGSPHNARAFIAGNRVGKSSTVLYELTAHLTGLYPAWWVGRRFLRIPAERPINAWAAGEDVKAVRESLQIILLGPPGALGTGIIPKANLISVTPRAGVPEAVDTIAVRHTNGTISRCVLKTYDQGRESFQGAKVDVMVFDEEPPMDIYSEGQTRTLSTVPGEPSGIVLCAFTPLKSLSHVVRAYLSNLGQAA